MYHPCRWGAVKPSETRKMIIWKLTKKTGNAIISLDDLTHDELIDEMHELLLFAHHGLMKKVYRKSTLAHPIVTEYTIIGGEDDDDIIYTFEREEIENNA